MLVTIRDLNRLIEAKKRERHATYNKIIEMCMSKVMRYAQEQQYNCLFDVPEIMLGEPLYKLSSAMEYVVDHLRNDAGMLVKVLPPKTLYVSWSYEELHAHQKRLITPPPLRPISSATIHQLPTTHRGNASMFPDTRFHPMTIMQNDMAARMHSHRPTPAFAPSPIPQTPSPSPIPPSTPPSSTPLPPPPSNFPNVNNNNHHHPQTLPPTVTDWLAPPQSSRRVVRRPGIGSTVDNGIDASGSSSSGSSSSGSSSFASFEQKPSGKIILNLE